MKQNIDDINWPKAILTNLIDGIIGFDNNGTVKYINPAARRLINLPTTDIIENNINNILTFRNPDTNDLIPIPETKSFTPKKKKIIFTRIIFLNPVGKERFINAVFVPLKCEQNNTCGVILRFRDVTAATIRQRKSLNEQKIKAIGTMAGGIANDFINWLDIMESHATAITDTLIPGTRAHEEALNIIHTAKQAKGMTRRLMSISHIAAADTNHHIEPVNINTVIRIAIRQTRQIFINTDIEFNVKYCKNAIFVMANETILVDCLINIFRNSIDAMPSGGVISVSVSKAKKGAQKNFAIIKITDTGIGMSKETIQQACNPFFSTKDLTSGWGLGLTLVKEFATNFGGDIKISSKENEGTTVRFILPLADTATESNQLYLNNHNLTILVIDNHREILDEITEYLENIAENILTASTAEEAMKIFHKHKSSIDIAIIDVIMPGKDGKYIYDKITKENPDIPIILTSGFSRNYIREYIKTSGWQYLQKPIDKKYLAAIINRILNV